MRLCVRTGLCVVMLLLVAAAVGEGQGYPGLTGRGPIPRAGLLRSNQVLCGISVTGDLCSDWDDAFLVTGFQFWPKDTPDSYIFRSGLQLGGIVASAPGLVWSGDTVGAYFFDQRGFTNGSPLSGVYDSRRPAHRKAWPPEALALDTAVFHPLLLGDTAVSAQDLWLRYWDGDPRLIAGRTHPMGVLVELRALAFPYPNGNEDVVYFVLTLTNVTARDVGAYAGLPAAARGYAITLGQTFQDSNEAVLGVTIPDVGYTLTDVYAAITMDADVGDAQENHTSAILPFRMGLAYRNGFLEPGWVYPPDVFSVPPFFPAPGFVGVTVPRAPADLAVYTSYTGAPTGFPAPVGVGQLWRYLSANVSSSYGDSPCTFPNPKERRLCFLPQSASDKRFTDSHGPFTLAPGEAKSLVVAYLFAAPLDTARSYVGSQFPPGTPHDGDSIALDTTRIRALERAAGWLTQADADGDGVIAAREVVTAPRSLLHKAQIAQAVVDAKFLLAQPPAAPVFSLLPGSDAVTITWQPSATEAAGDPYFFVAWDTASVLYDPNFRRFDVEGYRIYRGTAPQQLELIAEFDYSGTFLRDYTGSVLYPGRCAPELGVTSDCPVPFGPVPDTTIYVDHPLTGDLVQVPAGGRVELANGDVLLYRADTTGTLRDSDVPFTFTDASVRNGFTYYYAVTAFDVNSVRSALGSLESAPLAQMVQPRWDAAASPATRVHTVPDPLYVVSGYEQGGSDPILWFVNLPSPAIVRIYSASGILVDVVTHNDPTGGGAATWDLRSRTGHRVASGIYFFHVESPGTRGQVGRFTVVTR